MMAYLTIPCLKDTDLFMEDILAVDFTMIKLKLMDKEEGQGWSAEQCSEAEKEYKRFLGLKRAYPEKDIVPNKMVDSFWHQHILDTEKYAQDCELLFNRFMHHYPYFGMNGDQDAQNLVDAFEETKILYKRHFHDVYAGKKRRCTAPKCRTQCKPMKCK